MRSMFNKITLVLVLGLILFIFVVFFFYAQVRNSTVRINNTISSEQQIGAVYAMRDLLMSDLSDDEIKRILDKYTNDYKSSISGFELYEAKVDVFGNVTKNSEGEPEVKDLNDPKYDSNPLDNDTVNYLPLEIKLSSPQNKHPNDKSPYVLYVREKGVSSEGMVNDGKVIFTMAIVTIGWLLLVISLIYLVLIPPLKKLSVAVGQVNYGNTKIKIPYYGNDDIGVLCRKLERMGERLQKSEDDQSNLLQAISHDVKTPLTAIKGFSKRLVEGKVKEGREEEYYRTIYRRAMDLEELLEEFDDYSRLNVKEKMEFVKVEALDFTDTMVRNLISEFEDTNCRFNYDININNKVCIDIDLKNLKRVFYNIVSNSIKYSKKDNDLEIDIKCYIENGNVFYSIGDNGVGVNEKEIEKIFNRFYRVESSRSRENGGTGLGLSICREIIEAHGGTIEAKNGEDSGLNVVFSIPISQYLEI